MNIIDIVAMLCLLQYVAFAGLVAKARYTYGVKAPAVTGNEQFERIYRVQMNTLELLVVLLPAMYAAARYMPAWVAGGAGIIYLVGRTLYWRAYVASPDRRGLGFNLSFYPAIALVLATLVTAALGRSAA